MLGVHRNTVNAALAELVAQAWVETQPARGVFVRALSQSESPRPFARGVSLRSETPVRLGFELGKAPGQALPARKLPAESLVLTGGVPDPRLFPHELLARAYRRADVGVVYPVARGSAPVLVLLAEVTLLGASPGVWQAAGVLLVGGGVLAVRGLSDTTSWRDVGLALAVGATIAGYTLFDRRGVQHAAVLPYFELCLLPSAVVVPLLVWRSPAPAALRAAATRSSLLAGAGMFAAYALVLAALRQAPAAAVAAVRESSVVMAALATSAGLGGERTAGGHRLIGAAAVAAGVVLIALG